MTASERESIKAALRAAGTIAGAARALGVERRRLSEKVNADPDLRAEIPSKKTPSVADRPSVTIKGHEATIVTEAAPTLGEIEDV
ncbi:MAG TPA: helix-turn-helix domain-containing protein, partial [Candidatus Thermoplasmatota archaeon]|nr:helix-turn-helix domain-containing protein [Candidatus Thermoplasmatota archaeon]